MSEMQYLERVIEDPEGVYVKEIASFLGRSEKAVSMKIDELKKNKFKSKIGHNFNGWQPEEINILKSMITNYPYQEIAKKLGKTTRAVQDKAHSLGLYRTSRCLKYDDVKKYATGKYSIKEMAFLLNSKYGTVYGFIKNHPELKYKKIINESRRKQKEMEHKIWQYRKQTFSS